MRKLLYVVVALSLLLTLILVATPAMAKPPSCTKTDLTVDDVTGAYGGMVTLTAKLTMHSGGGCITGENIDFYLNGVYAGSDTTNESGVATVENVPLITEGECNISPGVYEHTLLCHDCGIYAKFGGGDGYCKSDDYGTLTVSVGGASPGSQVKNGSEAGWEWIDGGGLHFWLFGSAAKACDGYDAFVLLNSGAYSHYLKLTDFGFSIPEDATIQGIEVDVTGYASNEGVTDYSVKLVKDGEIVGTDGSNSTDWPQEVCDMVHGGASDLWGSRWTPDDINSPGFGVALSVINNASKSLRLPGVDCVEITVYYEEGVGPSITLDLLGLGQGEGSYGSPDGGATLDIPGGDNVTGGDGGPVYQIGAAGFLAGDPGVPSAPGGACMIGMAYDFTPSGATFDPPATLTIKYNLDDLGSYCPDCAVNPDPSSFVIAYWDTTSGEWTALDSTVDLANQTVSAQISVVTWFALFCGLPPAPPPE
jgi:hypothetical protein